MLSFHARNCEVGLCFAPSRSRKVNLTSIELTDELQRILDRAMKSGLYSKPEDVVSSALRFLEDLDDLSLIADRAAEPRSSLSIVEAELRAEGLLA